MCYNERIVVVVIGVGRWRQEMCVCGSDRIKKVVGVRGVETIEEYNVGKI